MMVSERYYMVFESSVILQISKTMKDWRLLIGQFESSVILQISKTCCGNVAENVAFESSVILQISKTHHMR